MRSNDDPGRAAGSGEPYCASLNGCTETFSHHGGAPCRWVYPTAGNGEGEVSMEWPIGLCIACAHHKELGLWKRNAYGQTPDDPEGLCVACRDAAMPVRGPCSDTCRCGEKRRGTTAEYPTRVDAGKRAK